MVQSLSLRRAWIEITTRWNYPRHCCRRSPYGERGLKYLTARSSFAKNPCRSPYGERGLKYNGQKAKSGLNKSLSLRRAWIEIAKRGTKHPFQTSRSPYGERGLKLPVVTGLGVIGVSLSLRRAWIEMLAWAMMSAR